MLYSGKASANFENANAFCLTGTSDGSTTNGSNSTPSGTDDGKGGANTPKGHVSAKTVADIKTIAQHMNSEYGFGENQLAIIMSVALRESTWQLDANNSGGQVAGLFQWGYGKTNGDRITPAGVDPSHLDVNSTIKILDYEIKGGVNAQTTTMIAGMKDAGNDKTKAFIAWAKYEGVSVSDGQSKTDEVIKWADSVAQILGTDSMKINQSKIDSLKSSGGGANSDTTNGGTQTDVSDNTICGTASSGDATDGTGSIGNHDKYVWKKDDVPADVKQFIHDPEKAGLPFHGSNNWLSGISTGGQCTDFAESYFNLIWGLHMTSGVHGDGKDVAKALASKLGGDTTSTPKAGAVASVPAFKGGSEEHGHVMIVEHVLQNGDIVAAEQNYAGVSGDQNNEQHSWNYRVITKASYTQDGYQFYTPTSGTLNWGN